MQNRKILRVNTISEFHKVSGIPKPPSHPLISVINYAEVKRDPIYHDTSFVLGYYNIGLKRNVPGKIRYGQSEYDFDEGLMSFMAPGQVLTIVQNENKPVQSPSGWILLIHPDFLWNTSLGKNIKKYTFFDYEIKEALFLSEKEEAIIEGLFQNIKSETETNIDKFSQDIIIAQIELLLSYAERFYNRQFITRKVGNHKILDGLEKLLEDYFNSDDLVKKGLPSVQYLATSLHTSTSYLSSLLKSLTGQSTQQHIHNKLIEKSKELLSGTDLSVREIAYKLGFGHSQSFNKLFKSKINQSPLEFRQSFM